MLIVEGLEQSNEYIFRGLLKDWSRLMNICLGSVEELRQIKEYIA